MRRSKEKIFAVEQHMIQRQIIEMLNLNHGFYLYELDKNLELQKQIMEMVPEICKYFAHVNITGLIYPEKCKRAWLSIARGVLKSKYKVKYRPCRYNTPEGGVFTLKYYVEPIPGTTNDSNSDSVSIGEEEKIRLNLKKRPGRRSSDRDEMYKLRKMTSKEKADNARRLKEELKDNIARLERNRREEVPCYSESRKYNNPSKKNMGDSNKENKERDGRILPKKKPVLQLKKKEIEEFKKSLDEEKIETIKIIEDLSKKKKDGPPVVIKVRNI